MRERGREREREKMGLPFGPRAREKRLTQILNLITSVESPESMQGKGPHSLCTTSMLLLIPLWAHLVPTGP